MASTAFHHRRFFLFSEAAYPNCAIFVRRTVGRHQHQTLQFRIIGVLCRIPAHAVFLLSKYKKRDLYLSCRFDSIQAPLLLSVIPFSLLILLPGTGLKNCFLIHPAGKLHLFPGRFPALIIPVRLGKGLHTHIPQSQYTLVGVLSILD